MNTKYNIYKLKKTDTLKSISNELKKTPQEVAQFHNIFADDSNLIGVAFPENFKELYVPITVSIKELEHFPKVAFDYDSYLNIKPFKEQLIYQVENHIITKGTNYILKFQAGIKFIKKSNGNFIIEINKYKREKDKKLDSILYNLLERLEKVFYPLQVIVSNEGQILKINNYNQILKNWKQLKPSIFEEYEGKIIENYVSHFEKNILNEKKLEVFLFKDLFLKTYFNQLYDNYTSSFFYEKQYSFPILPKMRNVDYLIKQKIDPFLTKQGKIKIEIIGQSNDKRTQLDYESKLDEPFFIENNSNRVIKGVLEGKYILNAKTHIIEDACLKCDLQLDHYESITVSISLINEKKILNNSLN